MVIVTDKKTGSAPQPASLSGFSSLLTPSAGNREGEFNKFRAEESILLQSIVKKLAPDGSRSPVLEIPDSEINRVGEFIRRFEKALDVQSPLPSWIDDRRVAHCARGMILTALQRSNAKIDKGVFGIHELLAKRALEVFDMPSFYANWALSKAGPPGRFLAGFVNPAPASGGGDLLAAASYAGYNAKQLGRAFQKALERLEMLKLKLANTTVGKELFSKSIDRLTALAKPISGELPMAMPKLKVPKVGLPEFRDTVKKFRDLLSAPPIDAQAISAAETEVFYGLRNSTRHGDVANRAAFFLNELKFSSGSAEFKEAVAGRVLDLLNELNPNAVLRSDRLHSAVSSVLTRDSKVRARLGELLLNALESIPKKLHINKFLLDSLNRLSQGTQWRSNFGDRIKPLVDSDPSLRSLFRQNWESVNIVSKS